MAIRSVLVLITICSVLFAQGKINVPASAASDFQSRFPGMTPEWEKEGSMFEAEFMANGAEISVLYDASGAFQYMESDTDPASLPGNVMEVVTNAHPGFKVLEAETRIGVAGTEGQMFVLEIEKNGTVREVTIDVSGNIISDIQEKNEKHKD